MDTNSNLLVAVLAHTQKLIDLPTLVDVCRNWSHDKRQSMADLLVSRQCITRADSTRLEELVSAETKRAQGDSGLALSRHSSLQLWEQLRAVRDIDLQFTLDAAESTPASDHRPSGSPPPPDVQSPSEGRSRRYRILREFDRGGLGIIQLARDEELGRSVAVKEMKPTHAHRSDHRARFVQEAEITAALEHPGIVPIYGFGHYADGRPYYAMRLIEGESLHQSIERFHDNPQLQADPTRRTLEFRQLLQQFCSLCQTVGFAHNRGIIHRDIKPANVRVGRFGETIVLDWGLAKRFDSSERTSATAGPASGGQAVRTTSKAADLTSAASTPQSQVSSGEMPTVGDTSSLAAGDPGITAAGAVVGTPPYMSPEQARGELEQLGPASDIYSLGGTFYTLLTGRLPYEGNDRTEILAKVQQGQLRSPREVMPQVPPALEAICLRAMAFDPSGRYPTCQSLVDDVQRWLADEPVSVYRESWWKRGRRWAKRHKALVAGLTSVAATLLVVTTTVGLKQQAETRQLRAESALLWNLARQSQQQHDPVDERRHLTSLVSKTNGRTSLNDLWQPASARLEQLDSVDRARAGIESSLTDLTPLRDKLRYYSLSDDNHPELQPALLEAKQILGSHPWPATLAAAQLPETQETNFRRLLVETLLLTARLEVDQAAVEQRPGQIQASLEALSQARALNQGQWAVCRLQHAWYSALGQTELAALAARQLELAPRDTAFDLFWLGEEQRQAGQWELAAGSYENSLALDRQQFWAYYFLAICRLQLHEPARSVAAYDQALLIAQGPEPALENLLPWVYSGRALAFADARLWPQAAAELERAAAIAPGSYGVHNNYGIVLYSQATQSDDLAAPNRRELFTRAIEHFQQAQTASGAAADIANNLGNALRERALTYSSKDSMVELSEPAHEPADAAESARRDLRAALEQYDQALEASPGHPRYLINRGLTQSRLEQFDAAIADLEAARRVAVSGSQLSSSDNAQGSRPQHRVSQLELSRWATLADSSLGEVLLLRGRKHVRAKEWSAAQQDFTDAQTHLLPATAKADSNASAHLQLGLARFELWQAALRDPQGMFQPDLLELIQRDLEAAERADRGTLRRQQWAALYLARGTVRDALVDPQANVALSQASAAVADLQRALEYGTVRPQSVRLTRAWLMVLGFQEAQGEFNDLLAHAQELDTAQQAHAYNGRGYVLALSGQVDAAVADAERAVPLGSQRFEILYNAACVYGVAAGVARHELADEPRAEKLAGRAVELLKLALQINPAAKDSIRRDRAFVALNGNPEYRGLFE